ncbi:MAG: hypothetical protein JRH01_18520 [Deltaproteobacteria bacterium]|nr:hypothetical protein [Deltaproteobacteria bacterium]MBW2396399.1 hypothetical protein [Deltaproteobacteria bacterium]
MTASASAAGELYAEREKRVRDAIELRTPDRVPIIFFCHFWAARYAGMSFREAMYDCEKLNEAARKAILELEPDIFQLPHAAVNLGRPMELMDYKQLEWPGHRGVDPNVPYQYLDREYMLAEEYQEYIFDPTGFMLRKYLPRVAGVFEPFAMLPEVSTLFYLKLIHSTAAVATPAMAEAGRALFQAGRESQQMLGTSAQLIAELTELGFPNNNLSFTSAPFDMFADYFRGSKGAMLDMIRHPDDLLAAMDKAAEILIRGVLADAAITGAQTVFIPLHWCLDGFMSPAQFETFFWPPLRKLLCALVEADLVPHVLWEGDCTTRLETIADVPRAKLVYFFERTDLFRAKEVLGDTVCLRGNVPAPMLTTGTPDDVRGFCRRLIEGVGRDGGLILDGGIGIPDDAKPENVRAMFASVAEYGA